MKSSAQLTLKGHCNHYHALIFGSDNLGLVCLLGPHQVVPGVVESSQEAKTPFLPLRTEGH